MCVRQLPIQAGLTTWSTRANEKDDSSQVNILKTYLYLIYIQSTLCEIYRARLYVHVKLERGKEMSNYKCISTEEVQRMLVGLKLIL